MPKRHEWIAFIGIVLIAVPFGVFVPIIYPLKKTQREALTERGKYLARERKMLADSRNHFDLSKNLIAESIDESAFLFEDPADGRKISGRKYRSDVKRRFEDFRSNIHQYKLVELMRMQQQVLADANLDPEMVRLDEQITEAGKLRIAVDRIDAEIAGNDRRMRALLGSAMFFFAAGIGALCWSAYAKKRTGRGDDVPQAK